MRPPLPLTVIGGYLGAGKTTLINRLLTEDHGKRLMIMVNDFGAVNIDAALLASASDDTLELTNGCVCCTMGADLFMAVGDVLDRPERPDHLIIEASGIADPAKIADVSRAEPDLSYAGIVTIVDGLNFETLLEDSQIAPQLKDQVRVADLLMISKIAATTGLVDALTTLGAARFLPGDADIGPFLWDMSGTAPEPAAGHAHFVRWSGSGNNIHNRADLIAKLETRPDGLYRIKGFVAGPDGQHQVQVVGKSVEVTHATTRHLATLVGIGVQGQVSVADIESWWSGI